MTNEPAVTIGSISAATAALLGLAIAFGVPLSDDQRVAILGAIAAVAPLVVGLLIRGKVTPAGNVLAYLPKRAATEVLAGEASSAPTGEVIDLAA